MNRKLRKSPGRTMRDGKAILRTTRRVAPEFGFGRWYRQVALRLFGSPSGTYLAIRQKALGVDQVTRMLLKLLRAGRPPPRSFHRIWNHRRRRIARHHICPRPALSRDDWRPEGRHVGPAGNGPPPYAPQASPGTALLLIPRPRREGHLHGGEGLRHGAALLRCVRMALDRGIVQAGHGRVGIEIDLCDGKPFAHLLEVTFAAVRADCGGCPAFERMPESAMEKQPRAPLISSSGFVLAPSPKRDLEVIRRHVEGAAAQSPRARCLPSGSPFTIQRLPMRCHCVLL